MLQLNPESVEPKVHYLLEPNVEDLNLEPYSEKCLFQSEENSQVPETESTQRSQINKRNQIIEKFEVTEVLSPPCCLTHRNSLTNTDTIDLTVALIRNLDPSFNTEVVLHSEEVNSRHQSPSVLEENTEVEEISEVFVVEVPVMEDSQEAENIEMQNLKT